MKSLDQFAQNKLDDLERRHLRRALSDTYREDGIWVERDGRRLLSFSCNDYLNLTQHPAVKQAALEALKVYGAGSGASRLVTGNHPLYAALEARLARIKQTEAAVVFGSGYLANAGIIPVLIGRDGLVLLDELSHACLYAGAQLSRGKVMSFRHNDVAHARELLARHRGEHDHAMLVTDGVFSMDGDLAPLAELLGAGKRARRLADVGRRPWPRRGRRRPRLELHRQHTNSDSLANGHAVEGGWRLWRLFVRFGAGDRIDAQPRAHADLFDRPAAGDRRRRDRRPRPDRARTRLCRTAGTKSESFHASRRPAASAKPDRAGGHRG